MLEYRRPSFSGTFSFAKPSSLQILGSRLDWNISGGMEYDFFIIIVIVCCKNASGLVSFKVNCQVSSFAHDGISTGERRPLHP